MTGCDGETGLGDCGCDGETGLGDCGCDGDTELGDCGYDGDTGSAVVASLSAIVPPDAAVPSQVKTKHYTGTNQHTRKLISARNT